MTSRRAFLAGALAAPLFAGTRPKPAVCLFTKYVPGLSFEQLGVLLRDAGYDGADLAVRPKGSVLPERAAEDLPRAVETLARSNVAVPMITTEITARDPSARKLLRTAAALKVSCFKPGYWEYGSGDPAARLRQVAQEIRALADLAGECGIGMALHNHSGGRVGEAVWDYWEILRDLDPRIAGFYYDPGHAAIEGGAGGHAVSLRLALPRMKAVAVKDFVWEESRTAWRPLGRGHVQWKSVFDALAGADFGGPVSVHPEYAPADFAAAARQDLAFVRDQIARAYA